MADWNWTFAISLFSNTAVMVFVLVFAYSAVRVLVSHWKTLTPAARLGLLSVVVTMFYIMLRIGYWTPTMWLSDVGGTDRYHQGWIQYRWVSYVPSSILGLMGASMLAVSLLSWSGKKVAAVLLVSALAGTAVGLTWIFSENDLWFDRQKVIEWHNELTGYECPDESS